MVPSGLKFIPLIPGVSVETSFVCTKLNSANELEVNKVRKNMTNKFFGGVHNLLQFENFSLA